jgi:hypothetical protein
MRMLQSAALMAGLALLAPGGVRATNDGHYAMQRIAGVGDRVGDLQIPPTYTFFLGSLNDAGQLLIDAGAFDSSQPDFLIRYADGPSIPIMAPGIEGPMGLWPKDVTADGISSMNQRGDLVFAAARRYNGNPLGTFLWNSQTGKATAVALKGMPAVQNLTFTEPAGFSPVINNRNEIAFPAAVKNPAGPSGAGLFFLARDGQLLPVALPGQQLPDGGKINLNLFSLPSLNDGGQVAFLARRPADKQDSAYVWELGTISPVVTVGTAAPGGGKITAVSSVLLNNQNRSVLVAAGIGGSARHGLYRAAADQVTPVAVPGQEMPGGGRFSTLQNAFPFSEGFRCLGVSAANGVGQHVLLATLEDGTTAAYLMDPDGKLSLILKSGTTTELGRITTVGGPSPASLNGKGQVALDVRIDGGPETIALLTPIAP